MTTATKNPRVRTVSTRGSSGETPARPRVRISAQWRKLLALLPGYDSIATAQPGDWFDEAAARLAVDFFHECLTHTKGARATSALALEPWQQAIVGALFGWKMPNGKRRYREVLIYVPRKNGKTTLAAGLILFTLFCDGEPGAEIYTAAADREQATLMFSIAMSMVEAEPWMRSKVDDLTKILKLKGTNSYYKAISADAATKHGYHVHLAVCDELHAQPNRDLVDVLETGTAERTQPIFANITTSDFDRESICNEKHDYAGKVRDGVIVDPAFLPVIYEASRDDDWTSQKVWAKANPNLGVSLPLEYMQRQCAKARETPSYENTFKRLHLNIKTEQAERWLQLAHWDACAKPRTPDELRGQPCYAGLDLSSTTDLTALVLAFPDVGGFYDLLCWFWVPTNNAHKRERVDRVPYETWARQGLVTLTEGDVVDYDVVRTTINEVAQDYPIQEIAFDPYNAAQVSHQLQGDGFEMVQFRQGYLSMSPPCKEFERLNISGKLRHGGNPVLRWMAANVAVEHDHTENIKLNKPRSSGRIDGIVASIMAIGRATASDPESRCRYDTEDLRVLE